MRHRRLVSGVAVAVVAGVALAGCGAGSGSAVSAPTIPHARIFALSGFEPAGVVRAGRPVRLSFTVLQPDGKPLTSYKTGSGPHTGIHLIIVRDDLSVIIHHHPPVGADGRLADTITFASPGPYKVLIDLYPNIAGGQQNFQLFTTVNVSGAYRPRALPPFRASQLVGGYRFTMTGHPSLKAIQAALVDVEVRDRQGRKVTFTPWFGALAHAIFFHQGSLDYFHTHVCGAGATNCTSALGAARVAGTSTEPGKLSLGVLLPVSGTWELFLQAQIGGRVLTVPYTLAVA
jgi:hypothetical protein